MFEWYPESTGRSYGILLTGKVTHQDLLHIFHRLEDALNHHPKIRLMIVMHNLQGIEAGAFVEDLKFELKYLHRIERVAFVGDATWQRCWAKLTEMLLRPFFHSQVEFFEYPSLSEAWEWLVLPPPWAPN